MKKPDLSIIIVNFNTVEFLVNCLASIHASDWKGSKEVLVVDNASSDGNIDSVKKSFPEVKLIINNSNRGFSKANNQAIKEARGKYILLLNPDTILDRNSISGMLDFMDKNPTVSLSTCRVELPNGKLDDACHRGFPTPWNAFCHFSGISALFPKSGLLNGYHLGYCNMDKAHEIDSCTGAFMLIRKSAGDRVGWLDEDYFWYGEDLDFCYRIKQADLRIYYNPEVKIKHYKGVASGIIKNSQKVSTADDKTRLTATRARFNVMRIFYKKHYGSKYPGWMKNFMLLSIRMKEYLTLIQLKHSR